MAQIIYISTDYLKKYTNLSSNIDDEILRPSIIKAQDLYISPFLGVSLDNELKNAIFNNTLTNIQTDLLTLIKKSQAEFTAYMAYVDVIFRFLNKAAQTGNSDNATPVGKDDLIYIRDIAYKNGQFYLQRIKEFLIDNKVDFPDWYNTFCKKGDDNYSTGIIYTDYNLKYQNPTYKNLNNNGFDII